MSNASSRPKRDARLAQRFGARLQDLRQHADLSQLALSTKCGVHVSFVSAIEQGRRQPSLMTLAKLAKGLGVRLEDLVAGVGEDDDRNGTVLSRIAQLVRAMPRDKADLAVELVETLAKKG